MVVIDFIDLDKYVNIGDKLLIDYGGMVLTVMGFETEEKYLKKGK
jgi:hypothetical protein